MNPSVTYAFVQLFVQFQPIGVSVADGFGRFDRMLGSRIEDGRFGVFADAHCHLSCQIFRIEFEPSGIDLSEVESQRYGFSNFDCSLCILRNFSGDFMGYGFGIEDIGLQVVVRLWIFPSVGYQRVG